MTDRARTSQPERHDSVAAILSSLLALHSAASQEAIADAAAMAAERGLGAPFAFVFIEDGDGALQYIAPASDLRKRSHRTASDALGAVLFRTKIDPRDLPVVAETLDTGSPVDATLGDLFGPMIGADRAKSAAASLGADDACVAPLEYAGERIGAMIALGSDVLATDHVRLLAEHVACASVRLRGADASPEQGTVADVARALFDARKLEAELQREVSRSLRHKRDVSICIIEATNVRLLRERFGRTLTEQLLAKLGAALARDTREVDVIGDYKESGYAMILTETASAGAESAAQRLLEIARAALDAADNVPGLELHLAVGHATCPHDGSSAEALFQSAEGRMYGTAAA